ncbi:hypothetical protein MMPV_005587 [Pyropia vietnamensis]
MAPPLRANDVLTIFFIRSPADIPLALDAPPDCLRSVGVAAAAPRFTHQIFPDEEIVGYAPGLAIRLLYTAGSMMSYLAITGAADAEVEKDPDVAPRRGDAGAEDIVPVTCPRGVGGGGRGARAAKRADAAARRPSGGGSGNSAEKTDIVGRLARHVAPSAVSSVNEFVAAAAMPWSPPLPPSCVVAEYTLSPRPPVSGSTVDGVNGGGGADRGSGGGGNGGGSATSADRGGVYRVYKCRLNDHPDALAYHKRIQAHAMLHINNASYIDDADPRWEIFFTWWFPDDATDGGSDGGDGHGVEFVAYATIYPFAVYEVAPPVAPTHPRVGRTARAPGGGHRGGGDGGGGSGGRFRDRVRIAQVLVIPPHQRMGHGSHLLSAIYADAAARDATEVTVEDPSAGCRSLRDVTDLRRALSAGLLPRAPEALSYDAVPGVVERLRRSLRVTAGQARRVVEMHLLRGVAGGKGVGAEGAGVDEGGEGVDGGGRAWRLFVKRRLWVEWEEVLGPVAEGAARKAKLAEIYADVLEEYRAVLQRL